MCTSPIHIKAKSSKFFDGSLRVSERLAYDVPCGRCEECKQQKIDAYTLRCLAEYKSSGYRASFVTLTYNDDNLPKVINRKSGVHDGTEWLEEPTLFSTSVWNKAHVQKFLKTLNERILYIIGTEKLNIQRLRVADGHRRITPEWKEFLSNTPRPLKYIVTCERGSADIYTDDKGRTRQGTARPHYHAILLIQNPLFSVSELNQLVKEVWKYGHSYNIQIGDPVTMHEDRNFVQSIQYVTKYVTKDIHDRSCSLIFRNDYERLNHLPFTLSSNGLGIDLLNDLTDDEVLESVEKGFAVPTSKMLDRSINIPQYNLNKRSKFYFDDGTFVKERMHDGFLDISDDFIPSVIPLVEKEYYICHRVLSQPNELGHKLALNNLHRKATHYAETLELLQKYPQLLDTAKAFSFTKVKDYDTDDIYQFHPDDIYLFITDELYYSCDQSEYFDTKYKTYVFLRAYLQTLKHKRRIEHDIRYKNNLASAVSNSPHLFNRKPI